MAVIIYFQREPPYFEPQETNQDHILRSSGRYIKLEQSLHHRAERCSNGLLLQANLVGADDCADFSAGVSCITTERNLTECLTP